MLIKKSISNYLLSAKLLTLSVLFTCFYTKLYPQAIPQIINYKRSIYDSDRQNWSIAQDKNGFIYASNSAGIIKFDGSTWEHILEESALSSKIISADEGGNIHIGSFNDFGTIKYDQNGQELYLTRNKSSKRFNNIWQIHHFDKKTLYQGTGAAIIISESDSTIAAIDPKHKFLFSFVVDKKIYFFDLQAGLLEFRDGKLNEMPNVLLPKGAEVWAMFKAGDDLIIGTQLNGLYRLNKNTFEKWNTQVSKKLEKDHLYSYTTLPNGNMAFGTIQNGLYISDSSGNILIHLNKNSGLQNNTVLSILVDDTKNLWLGLDNGIDYINLNSDVKPLPNSNDIGAGYCATDFDNKLYLGTNKGLYYKQYNKQRQLDDNYIGVKNLNGQIWSLHSFDGKLFCGHNYGTSIIEGDKATLISEEKGGWKFLNPKNRNDIMFGGTFSGIVLYKKIDNKWKSFGKINGFDKSTKQIEEDEDGSFWISHYHEGIFNLTFSKNYDSIVKITNHNQNSVVLFDNKTTISKINNEIVFFTQSGIYTYQNSKFIKYNKFDNIINNNKLYFIIQTKNNTTWVIDKNQVSTILIDGTLNNITGVKKDLINGFELFYSLTDSTTLIGTQNGFSVYEKSKINHKKDSIEVFITKATYQTDSVFYKISATKTKNIFNHKKNAFSFAFTSTQYQELDEIYFSYILKGFNDNWSPLNSRNYVEYTSLPEGEYEFMVKATNSSGLKSNIDSISFIIRPPWYRSTWFLILVIFFYLLILIALFLFVKHVYQRQAKKKRQLDLLNYQNKEAILKEETMSEKMKIFELRNQLLASEIENRNKELANQAMDITYRNEFLTSIKSHLEKLSKENPNINSQIKNITIYIEKFTDNTRHRELFNIAFDSAHKDFFEKIHKINPDLTPNEKHICAYIKMNMNTKEIADFMHISIRGVETSRYRLRKKLNIPHSVNLTLFLSNL